MDQRVKLWIGVGCLLLTGFVAEASPVKISVKQGTHTAVEANSFAPAVSADGKVVAFESQARLTTDDKNTVRDIYVLDLPSGQLQRVPPPSKVRLNSGPSMSRDGKWVAFHSYNSANLVSKIPRTAEIYLYNLAEQRLTRLFDEMPGELQGGEALFPVLSGDNGQVLFTCNSKTRVRQVYLAGREGDLELISRAGSGASGNRPSGVAKLSRDGFTCVFVSGSTNFDDTLPVTSLSSHLYRKRFDTDSLERLDTFEKGFDDRERIVGGFDMDDDGDTVVFEGLHRSADPFETLSFIDLFVYDGQTKKVRLLSEGTFAGHARHPAVSGDGRYVAFSFSHPKEPAVVVFDRINSTWKPISEGGARSLVMSKNGCVIVFERFDKKFRNIYIANNPFMESDDACH
jgi:Tol biopolymer transport system component